MTSGRTIPVGGGGSAPSRHAIPMNDSAIVAMRPRGLHDPKVRRPTDRGRQTLPPREGPADDFRRAPASNLQALNECLEDRVRKVVLYTLMSLDGDVDDPGGYFTADQPAGRAPVFDDAMVENERRIIETQDTVLLGRHMYDEWAGYWPSSDEQPFADFINSVRKVVVTSTPLTKDWTNSEAVAGPISDVVADLKSGPGQDIGVHGSIQLAQSLLADDLVDDLELVVGPAAGFTGRRLFTTVRDIRRFELVSATPTPSGSVLLSYRRP